MCKQYKISYILKILIQNLKSEILIIKSKQVLQCIANINKKTTLTEFFVRDRHRASHMSVI